MHAGSISAKPSRKSRERRNVRNEMKKGGRDPPFTVRF
jgi:hypothetical protein